MPPPECQLKYKPARAARSGFTSYIGDKRAALQERLSATG